MSLRWHDDPTSVQRRCHFSVSFMPLQCVFAFTSTSLRPHCALDRVPCLMMLRMHSELAVVSLWIHFNFRSIILPSHPSFISTSSSEMCGLTARSAVCAWDADHKYILISSCLKLMDTIPDIPGITWMSRIHQTALNYKKILWFTWMLIKLYKVCTVENSSSSLLHGLPGSSVMRNCKSVDWRRTCFWNECFRRQEKRGS